MPLVFFAIRSSPAPHAQSQRIVKNFHDIVATALTKSNCLLPKVFIARIIDRGAVSLTGTNPHTLASCYAPYFDTITRILNQSFPIGSSPWLAFTLTPTAIQQAIHSVPTDILPDVDNQLYPWLNQSIQNAQAISIRLAMYPNKDSDLRPAKETTWLVVSVDLEHDEHLLPHLFHFSEPLKVEKMV